MHEGYGRAMGFRSNGVSILCGLADALLDCGRLQRGMLARGVDLVLAQPEAMAAGRHRLRVVFGAVVARAGGAARAAAATNDDLVGACA